VSVAVGDKFGDWTVLQTGVKHNGRVGLVVQCQCGARIIRDKRAVTSGASKSCGRCGRRGGHDGNPRSAVKVGDRYGRWRVLGLAGSNDFGQALVQVQCRCGTEPVVRLLASLRNGGSQSCGCLRDEINQARNVKRRKAATHTLACECGVGIKVVGQVSWWQCLSCGQEHVVLSEYQRRNSRR
jgi:hypothetical protein